VSHPEVEAQGVTWSGLAKLMQLANAHQGKCGLNGLYFNAAMQGKKSNKNLIKRTISGALEWRRLSFVPGVYLCGAVTAVAGHMFVLHATAEDLWVHDSMELHRQPFDSIDYSWVARWIFVYRCFPGHF
jgi:hypothetical protein